MAPGGGLYSTLQYITVQYIILHYITLHCITLHCIWHQVVDIARHAPLVDFVLPMDGLVEVRGGRNGM